MVLFRMLLSGHGPNINMNRFDMLMNRYTLAGVPDFGQM